MKRPNIVLVGQPNAGKSTVFNVLSDIKAFSSNFSGTTVSYTESNINIRDKTFHIVDLPGAYSLNPGDEAEKMTFKYLEKEQIDLIINVVDASLLSRSLELTVELIEFGIPMVIALNMWDEAERKGLKIYPEKLQKLLNVPVVTTSALYGKGIRKLVEVCYEQIFNPKITPPLDIEYTSHIEESVKKITEALTDLSLEKNGSPRFYGIKAIENPDVVPANILKKISLVVQNARENIVKAHKKSFHEIISYERHHIAMQLMEDISHFIDRKTIPRKEKVDRFLLHPILGYFPLLSFFLLFFVVIYFSGDLLGKVMAMPLGKLPGLYEGVRANNSFLWYSLDGIFHGIEGALGIVLPFFLPLIFLTSIFEDTGYLARVAFLLDAFMHKVGLHGKSVVPFILGFGCTVPALYGVRIIESRRDRIITAILLPFIPCTARTSIILALTAAFTGPLWAVFIYIYIMAILAVVGRLISFFSGRPTGLILEIPELKVPSLKVSLSKTWFRMKEFLKFAVPFLIVGSMIMGWLEYFNVNDRINHMISPLVKGVLGLPELLGSTFIFGFFRKELVLVMANSAFGVKSISELPLSMEQIVVFIIFAALYFPCLSTFIIMWKEFGKKLVLLASVLSIFVATIAAFILRTILY
jgi:ferrous iron transport protein B